MNFLTGHNPDDDQELVHFDVSAPQEGLDVVMRLVSQSEGADQTFQVRGVMSTQDLANRLFDIRKAYSFIQYAFKNSWKANKYKDLYINYIQGLFSEDEFMAQAEQFAEEFQTWDPADLAYAAMIIQQTLDEDIDSGDLSDLLSAEPQQIEASLTQCPLLAPTPTK